MGGKYNKFKLGIIIASKYHKNLKRTIMARTKQTARKNTGGKAPRKHIAHK